MGIRYEEVLLWETSQAVLPFVHPIFSEPENEDIDPRLALITQNDSQIMEIIATKRPTPVGSGISYKVTLVGE